MTDPRPISEESGPCVKECPACLGIPNTHHVRVWSPVPKREEFDWLLAENEKLEQELSSLRAENERLRDWLREYGIHRTDCGCFKGDDYTEDDCTCGLSALLKETK